MKKAILCIALTAALSTSAFALEVPSETVVQNLNGSQQVIKTYTLPPEGDPQELIEEPFVLEGYLYTFADIVKTENRADDTRAETETVTIETAKNDLSLILEQLAPTIDYDDGQYQGTLTLDHTTIRTEAAGYTTKSYTVTAAKTIGPVDRNDMSYVPATTVKDGRTLNLSNVEWQVTGTELVGGVLMPSSYDDAAAHVPQSPWNHTGRAGKAGRFLQPVVELSGAGETRTDCVSRGKIKSGDRGAACRAPHRPFRDGKRLPGVWGAAAGTRGGGIR